MNFSSKIRLLGVKGDFRLQMKVLKFLEIEPGLKIFDPEILDSNFCSEKFEIFSEISGSYEKKAKIGDFRWLK